MIVIERSRQLSATGRQPAQDERPFYPNSFVLDPNPLIYERVWLFYMNESFNLGSWLGRRQAFSALGGQGLFAETTCLLNIRDGRLYRTVSANWSDFCDQHIGVSRAHVDRLIQYR